MQQDFKNTINTHVRMHTQIHTFQAVAYKDAKLIKYMWHDTMTIFMHTLVQFVNILN